MFLAYLFRSDQTGFFLNRIQITPGRVRVKEGFRVVLDLVLVDRTKIHSVSCHGQSLYGATGSDAVRL